ncbi:MAG: leucyl aminopeptidase [Rhodoluna sp.]
MTSISFKVSTSAPKATNETIFVYAVGKDAAEAKLQGSAARMANLKALNLKALAVSGSFEATSRVNAGDSIIGFVGISEGIETHSKAREIGGAIGRAFNDAKSLIVDIPLATPEIALALLEGIAIVQYDFTRYKSGKPKVAALKNVHLVTNHTISKADLSKLRIISEALNTTRDLVNTPGNDLYPAKLAEIVKSQSNIENVTVEVWDEKKLAKEKCIGILSVGQGSVRGPRMVKITYSPPKAKSHLALVGKGITFDTGGISLKPPLGILGMKYDMAGAATIAQATLAIAKLGLPIKVTAFMCIAENMPSGSATRPTDVITFRNGKTVEVINTDAEGRLVMADGLILASELKPDLMIDLATLTGGARVALGNRYTGLMGEDKAVEAIEKAASAAGELVWHMPLAEELFDLLKSDVADFVNSRLGNPAGSMLVGGLFLREFVGLASDKGKERINWAHLDFATAANNDLAPYGYTVKGATGSMVRTLISVAEQMSAKQKK